jgi:hypothetical protein
MRLRTLIVFLVLLLPSAIFVWRNPDIPGFGKLDDDGLFFVSAKSLVTAIPAIQETPRWWYAGDRQSIANFYKDVVPCCRSRGLQYFLATSSEHSVDDPQLERVFEAPSGATCSG